MNSPPYMPLYVRDYRAATPDLTTMEHGAYFLLILWSWESGGSISNADDRLHRVVGLTLAEWTKIKPRISEFFSVDDGGIWRHKRVEAELARAREKVSQARAAGKASAQNRRSTSAERPLASGSTEAEPACNHSDSDSDPNKDSNLVTSSPKTSSLSKGMGKPGEISVGGWVGSVGGPVQAVVCQELGISDAAPLVAAFKKWPPAAGALDVDAMFRKAAPKILGNLPADVQVKIRITPSAPEPIIGPLPPVKASASLKNRVKQGRMS